MIEEKHDNWHVWRYTLAEYLHAAKHEAPHTKNADNCMAKEIDGRARWSTSFRGGTRDEAFALCAWPEGREKMRRINLDGAKLPEPVSVRRVRRWAEDGDEFNRDRFDAGRLDCWETRRRQRTVSGSTLRLTVELCASAFHDADELIWSGLAACKLADKLEGAGYRVEIDVTVSNSDLNGRGYQCVEVIRIKDAEDPLNIDAVLMALAHPLFFRFVVFSSWLRYPIRCTEGLGLAADTPRGLRGDVHIAKVFNQADAERTVSAAIASQEVTT